MEKVSCRELLSPVGIAAADDAEICSVTTDSREITRGALFVPLRGERFDGNDYIEMAFENGASRALTSRAELAGERIFYVKDTLRALQSMAAWYRRRFSILAVGVTGSVGKTSTREMAASVLSQSFDNIMTEKNYNNEIGVPLTMFRIEKRHETGVFEMGMSGFGEISRISAVAKPHIGIITNIGLSHIGRLGTQENILKAKLELLDGLDHDGALALNADDPLLWGLRGKLPVKTIYYGMNNDRAELFGKALVRESGFTQLAAGGMTATIHAAGLHHCCNAMAAICIGRLAGMQDEAIVRGIEAFSPREGAMRQEIKSVGGITIILDCYNASPDSMLAAFEVLTAQPAIGKRVAVLGGMLEMGDFAENAHYAVGLRAAECADVLICYGENSQYYAQGARDSRKNCEIFTELSHKGISDCLKACVSDGDVVLFKGSRGMKLEVAAADFCKYAEDNCHAC